MSSVTHLVTGQPDQHFTSGPTSVEAMLRGAEPMSSDEAHATIAAYNARFPNAAALTAYILSGKPSGDTRAS